MGVELMRLWPWQQAKTESRAVAGGDVNATDALVAALLREAGGHVADPDALAVAEACIGLWERCIGSATVAPPSMALEPVGACLPLVGRMLAWRGDSVFVIDTSGAGVRLWPASSWDVRGEADPDAWRYRVDLAGPSRTRTLDLPSASVLHFRVGRDAGTPWRGRSPLRRGQSTAALAAEIERQATAEAKLPTGRIVPLARPAGSNPVDSMRDMAEKLREGGLHVWSGGQGFGGEMQTAANRFAPQKYGAAPEQAFATLRGDVIEEIPGAFGIPPGLFAATGDGAGQREGWRRLWLGTIAPVGLMIQTELRAKLDPAATVDFDALRASDEDGRSRAVARRAQAFRTFADAGVGRAEALRLAGLESATS